MEAANTKLNSSQCKTLVSDGWKNVKGQKLICFIICTFEPVYLKNIEPGINKEDAIYVGKELIKAIQDVGPEKLSFIMTDNAMVMKAAWKKVEQEYPHIICIRRYCSWTQPACKGYHRTPYNEKNVYRC